MAKATLGWHTALTPEDADRIDALVDAAARVDAAEPVSEDVRLQLRAGAAVRGSVLLAHLPNLAEVTVLAGFAHLGPTGPARQAELLVHPDYRGLGVGSQLAEAVLTVAGGANEDAATAELAVWAHGDSAAAAALARRYGFARERVLLLLVRSIDDASVPPEPALPPGVRLRTFEPGRDDRQWLELNRLAFAGHPEQGRWTQSDLAARQGEPWFDPAGFFLAEADGRLAGFHWTKIHTGTHPAGGDAGVSALAGPVGEVYVIGVDPAFAGSGLGRALLVAGLRYLYGRGIPTVILYVDEDNAGAVRLYTRLGFGVFARDVSYVHRARSNPFA